MNTFEDRKKGFEAKYQNDQEAQFKIRAIRNRLVGEWAAELFKPTNELEYIKEVRLSDLEKPGDDDIIDKLLSDFESKNLCYLIHAFAYLTNDYLLHHHLKLLIQLS